MQRSLLNGYVQTKQPLYQSNQKKKEHTVFLYYHFCQFDKILMTPMSKKRCQIDKS